MTRIDHDLAFLLRFENIAWYEPGQVRILDRRVYPYELNFVTCYRHEEVAQAITDMVTQSGGPYLAAVMGMALACEEALKQSELSLEAYLKKAQQTIAFARPTTSKRMNQLCQNAVEKALAAAEAGHDPIEAVRQEALAEISERYRRYEQTARYLVAQFPQNGTVMTQCFGETIVGMMLRVAQEEKKSLSFICPETRPYLQGARLTASVICDMGFPVHVVTDNMPAYIMNEKGVDVFTSAADVITMDGHVVNKVGTFQFALSAHYWGIPYFVTGTPSLAHRTIDSVQIEERDPEQVLNHMGTRVCLEGVSAYYPAFDRTPPKFVSGVVTDKGIYSPYDLGRYFSDQDA